MTPVKSIRKYCVQHCMGEQPMEVKLCPSTDCILFPFRFGKGRPKLKQIKKFCFGCGEGTYNAVKNCEFKDCQLFTYRLGRNPKLSGKRGNVKNLVPFMKRKAI